MIDFHYIPADSAHLAASVHVPDTRPAPVVIVAHGLTGQRLGVSYHLVEFARRLRDAGIACIRFDQSGCGESTGEFQDLTIPRMAGDLASVRDWAGRQSWCDPDRVGLVGLSLGGLVTASEDAARPCRALALWAPVFDMPRVFQQTARTGLRALLEHQGWVPYRGLRVGKALIDQLDALDAGACLAASESPLLVCHSRVDDVVSYEEGRAYAERCEEIGRRCDFEAFDNANHDFLEYPDRQRLLQRTLHHFREHLLEP